MSVTTGDILRAVATMLWTDGNVMQNVFNAVITGGGGPWDDDDVVTDLTAWVKDVYDELVSDVSNTVDGSQVIGYIYDAIDDDWDELATNNWVWNPTNATGELPRGAAALMNARTTDPDTNGKKYMGGLCEDGLTNGLWTAGVLADMVLAGGKWITPVVKAATGALFTPGVWSPTDTVFKAMGTTVIYPTMPAYQRRRKRGVGI